ncbi:MAG: hypothetical protein K0S29_1118 [Gammaproteobacteria bacterium]|nr:hypothetical protein [Gammaproteobacteria bacterium]
MYQRLPSSVEQALRPRNRWNCNITSVFKVVAGGGLGACVGVAVGSAIMATGYGILNDSEMSGLPDSIGTAALIGVVGGGILGGLEGLIISLFKGPLFTAELAHPSASTVCVLVVWRCLLLD